ncbi:protein PtsH [Bergeriella denitrificans]|uniref:Protein PtsH n=2 Tax=Bergeriella denitrificans TaxID=494 RepID=A0A378UJC2_BERDE|nr:protein PtsH [Bergeriella denitrificans]
MPRATPKLFRPSEKPRRPACLPTHPFSDGLRQEENAMQKQSIEIINKLGLHARASSKFTQTASQFQSEVWVTKNGNRVNGKSIMGLMMLAAAKGSVIELETDGPDEAAAMQALADLINDYFGEGE